MPYLSASAVVIHYEEALGLSSVFTFTFTSTVANLLRRQLRIAI